MVERRLIAVEGVVQGVGFRPYVHRLATANELRGFVRNDAGGVLIDVEGDDAGLDAFCRALALAPPPLAAIGRVRVEAATPRAYGAFRIAESDGTSAGTRAAAPVPPDVATCDACLAELRDPADRRHGHPFISCTDCGPRFTIVRDTPYDRARTTMAALPMCAACRAEYGDPADRRFHAETIACWDCGPTLRAVAAPGCHAAADGATGPAALAAAAAALRDGGIVALKALGGYHLACDATSPGAVARLRARKRREARPLAVMVGTADRAAAACVLSDAERALLESPARPIVLLARRGGADSDGIAAAVAPGQGTLGVMLPSTPLHHLLLSAFDAGAEPGAGRPLVMTSGNRSGEPVAIDDAAALATLGGIADLFLMHDRPIAARCDDSVTRVAAGGARLVRRARGHAPRAVALPAPARRPVLAVGAHLKSAACLAVGTRAVLSAHVGDLDAAAARDALRAAIDGLLAAARVAPGVVAHDLHPDYASTHVAHALVAELGVGRRVAVQHHHAHVAACAAEHGVAGPVLGVALDGAGLGADGAVWGGEVLLADGAAFARLGHLAYVPLPGGDAAARRPWRAAAAHLAAAGAMPAERPAEVGAVEWDAVARLLARPERLPATSSVGRLFDAVASILGLCHVSRYEGEAAMRLEAVADVRAARPYPVALTGDAPWTADPGAIVRAVADDRRRGRPVAAIAGAFHLALRDLVALGCERSREETGVATVALTGGVFANALLLALADDALRARGFRVLLHREVPCNDGGLALGQAWVAARALAEEA